MNRAILALLCLAVMLFGVVSCGTLTQPQDAEVSKTDGDSLENYIGTWHDEFVPPNVLEIADQDDGKITCSLGIYRMTTFYLTVTVGSGEISFVDEYDLIAGRIDLEDNCVLVTIEKSNTEFVPVGAEYRFTIKAEASAQ